MITSKAAVGTYRGERNGSSGTRQDREQTSSYGEQLTEKLELWGVWGEH